MADSSFFNKTGTPPDAPVHFTVDDHGELSGLGDDDHPQYLNETRGDARYYSKTYLDSALAAKASSTHSHAISDTTGLQSALDGKAASSHAHAISDVTNLQATLDGKALSSHGHAIADVSGLQTALDGKASATHSHAIADVSGLQTALDGKAASTHSHAAADVSDFAEAVDDRVASLLTAGSNITLTYNDSANTLTISSTASGGSSSLSGLSDTTLTSPASGDLLRYNGTKWVNYADSAYAAASHSHSFASLTSTPTTLSGYGITDAYTKTATDTLLAGKSDTGHTHSFASLTSKPTTLSGYGITDAAGTGANTFTGAQAISSGTLSASAPALDITQTWNGSGLSFTAARINITDTASATSSYFLDFQLGGSSRFNVTKAGTVSTSGNLTVNGGTVTNSNNGIYQWSGRGILSSPGAGLIQLGTIDPTSGTTGPVAQTLQAQSSGTGQSNIAGADFTIQGSRSTGSASGGSVIIATATAGTAGTTQNAASERFRIGPAGQIGLSGANYGTSGQVLTSNGSSSAPTWQAAGGFTLLGSANTTSGTTVTLSSLTLTGYRYVYILLSSVGLASTTNSRVYLQTSSGTQISATLSAATNKLSGGILVDLSSGIPEDGVATYELTNAGAFVVNTKLNAQTATDARTTITTAATSISLASQGAAFNAGSFSVYGVK